MKQTNKGLRVSFQARFHVYRVDSGWAEEQMRRGGPMPMHPYFDHRGYSEYDRHEYEERWVY